MGKRHLKKDLLSIIAAHHIPYAAAASVAYPQDLQRKVRYAMGIDGPTFLVVHSPCPLGWPLNRTCAHSASERRI